jgi:hypothetical protein
MMDKEQDPHKIYFALLAKSYFEEQKDMMINFLERTPELDERLDISGFDAGEWSYDDCEWKLDDGTTFNPIEKLLFYPNLSFTEDLLKAPFLSLYECIFLVGQINGNFGIITDAIDIAYVAITKKTVSPRDPKTNLKYKDLPPIGFNSNVKIPDLSWLLSFEEAEDWAVNSFGLSFKEYRDKLENEKLLKMRAEAEAIDNAVAATLDEGRQDDQINTLLKIVLGMAIDAYGYDPQAQKNKATGGNSGSISAALSRIPGLSTHQDTIRKYLTEAASRNPSAKPQKS